VEWTTPAFTPSRRASPHFGRCSSCVPLRVEGWVGLSGWLQTEVVTHPSTNRAWHRVTLVIESNVLPLSQAAICQTQTSPHVVQTLLNITGLNTWPNIGWDTGEVSSNWNDQCNFCRFFSAMWYESQDGLTYSLLRLLKVNDSTVNCMWLPSVNYTWLPLSTPKNCVHILFLYQLQDKFTVQL